MSENLKELNIEILKLDISENEFSREGLIKILNNIGEIKKIESLILLI
jgi:hypothetical protein